MPRPASKFVTHGEPGAQMLPVTGTSASLPEITAGRTSYSPVAAPCPLVPARHSPWAAGVT